MTSLQATADGDGSLLDNTLLLYGAGMSEADVHSPYNLPTMVVGGPRFGVKGGRHVRVAKDTPLTNNMGLEMLLAHSWSGRMQLTMDPRLDDSVQPWKEGYSARARALRPVLLVVSLLELAWMAWVLRRTKLSLTDLFDPAGRYSYVGGTNWSAVAALVVAVAP